MSHNLTNLAKRIETGLHDVQVNVRRFADAAATERTPRLEVIQEPKGHLATDTTLQGDVRRARRLRQLRKRLLGDDFYSGPGWEILLHLFESYVTQLRDTVGKVCTGTDIPGATALRWLNRLEREGLIQLRDDPIDGRRRFVELSNAGVDAMSSYFGGVAPHLLAA